MTKPQVFSPGHNFQRLPPPVRTLQEEETERIEMSQEEVQEQIVYEDSAECMQYAEDSDLFKPEEYRLLVDSGAAINLIKEKILDHRDKNKDNLINSSWDEMSTSLRKQ